MDCMVVKRAYLPEDRLGEFTNLDLIAIEDNGGNFTFAKSSPIAVNLNQKSRILHSAVGPGLTVKWKHIK